MSVKTLTLTLASPKPASTTERGAKFEIIMIVIPALPAHLRLRHSDLLAVQLLILMSSAVFFFFFVQPPLWALKGFRGGVPHILKAC